MVSVRSRPNGLPIASTGSPTSTLLESRERERLQPALVDLQQREVGGRVLADDLGRVGLAVADLDLDGAGALDDVGVGDDVAVAGDHEAGARRGAGLALAERAVGLLGDLRSDVGHRVLGVLVDLVRGEGVRRGRGHRARGRETELAVAGELSCWSASVATAPAPPPTTAAATSGMRGLGRSMSSRLDAGRLALPGHSLRRSWGSHKKLISPALEVAVHGEAAVRLAERHRRGQQQRLA